MSNINKMCCCSSHLPHDESQKFLLFGDEESDKQVIFDSSNFLNNKKQPNDKNDKPKGTEHGEKIPILWRL